MSFLAILGAIVALDHALAQIPEIKSNSTGQLIFNIIGSVGSALMNIFSSKSD